MSVIAWSDWRNPPAISRSPTPGTKSDISGFKNPSLPDFVPVDAPGASVPPLRAYSVVRIEKTIRLIGCASS